MALHISIPSMWAMEGSEPGLGLGKFQTSMGCIEQQCLKTEQGKQSLLK